MTKWSFIYSVTTVAVVLVTVLVVVLLIDDVDVVVVVVVGQSIDDVITVNVTQYCVDCTNSLNHKKKDYYK